MSENIFFENDSTWDVYNKDKKNMRQFETGYTMIDKNARPRSGHVTIIGAPTNHGKSVFLKNIAVNIYKRYTDLQFLYYSFEERYIDCIDDMARMLYYDMFEKKDCIMMPREQYDKNVSGESGEVYGAHFGLVGQLNRRMHITDRRISPAILRKHIEQGISQYGNMSVIFIDYLQDMKPEAARNEYHAEMEEMMEQVDDIAREHNIAIIIPAQFKQNNKAVNKWNLIGLDCFFGSHAVSKKADVVYSVFNKTVFAMRTGSEADGYRSDSLLHDIEIDIIKQRKQNYASNIKMALYKPCGRIIEL